MTHGAAVKPSRAATSNRSLGVTKAPPVQGEQNIRSEVIPAVGQPTDRSCRVVHLETPAASGNFVSASTSLWRTMGTALRRYLAS
jgi:hypothetical protein